MQSPLIRHVTIGYVGPTYENSVDDLHSRSALTVMHSYIAGSKQKHRPVSFFVEDILQISWNLPNEAPLTGTRDVIILKGATERTVTLTRPGDRLLLRELFGLPPDIPATFDACVDATAR